MTCLLMDLIEDVTEWLKLRLLCFSALLAWKYCVIWICCLMNQVFFGFDNPWKAFKQRRNRKFLTCHCYLCLRLLGSMLQVSLLIPVMATNTSNCRLKKKLVLPSSSLNSKYFQVKNYFRRLICWKMIICYNRMEWTELHALFVMELRILKTHPCFHSTWSSQS